MIVGLRTLSSLARSLWAFLRRLFSKGPTLADDAVRDERDARCAACRHFVAQSGQCNLCTCYISLKTLLASQWCPDGRWHPQTRFSTGL